MTLAALALAGSLSLGADSALASVPAGGPLPRSSIAAVLAAALQSKIDDADTAAWLSAESALDPARREKAREVAEKFREALADRREAERKAKGP